MAKQNKRLFILLTVFLSLLLVPLIAMQFTGEVVWDSTDFLIAGCALVGLVLFIEVILRKVKNRAVRRVLFFVLVFLFVLFWAELAVGIFGSPLAGD